MSREQVVAHVTLPVTPERACVHLGETAAAQAHYAPQVQYSVFLKNDKNARLQVAERAQRRPRQRGGSRESDGRALSDPLHAAELNHGQLLRLRGRQESEKEFQPSNEEKKRAQ